MQVYKSIALVAGELAAVGVKKQQKNEAQNFRFRGIDDVMNTVSPIMARHGLMMLPRVLSRTMTERANARGTALLSVVVDVEYDIVAAEDGSRHTVRVMGEAMDSGDKATNKAMSAAYKYCLFQTFCVPVEGTPDADATTHEVIMAEPEGFGQWFLDLEVIAADGVKALAEAWKASNAMYQTFALQQRAEQLLALKLRASQVK